MSLYLLIRTAEPQAELYLYEDKTLIAEHKWQANRELARDLLAKLESFLAEQEKSFTDLSGLGAFRGPGSFTGLRIGLTVMNTLAYASNIPIVGTTGDDWAYEAINLLSEGENHKVVLPEYGADAHITTPKK